MPQTLYPPRRRGVAIPGRPSLPSGASGYETAPVVESLSPASDRIGGGAFITIRGQRFVSGATVQFGETSVPANVILSTGLTVTAPAHVEGAVDITVTNPNGESDTLELAFTYLAGHITSLSITRGPLAGGTEVTIFGMNFLDSSTITFGGVAATGVVFVDENTYLSVTPAHAKGLVDVVITEPSLTTVTGSFMFGYSDVIFGNEIRRQPSVQIQETTGGGENTASYTIDGRGVPPTGLEPVIFADNDGNTLFAGQAVKIEQSYEAKEPANLVWKAGCVDHIFRFNKYRPRGIYNKVSATDIANDLRQRYAPGFTSHIQSGLPEISLTLDGSDDMFTVFNQIKAKIPRADFWLDPERGVHLLVPPIVPRESTRPEHVGFGADQMIVTESDVSTLGHDFKPGYYYFYSAFGYTSEKTYTTPHVSIPIPPWPNYVQLSDQAADLNLTGSVSNGVYGLGFIRGWVIYDGSGNLIDEGDINDHIPRVVGDVLFATQDVATVLENKSGFESKLSAISDPIYLADFLPQFDNIPLGPTVGTRDCTERIIYAVRIGDEAILGSWSGLKVYSVVDDNTTTGPIVPIPTYANPTRKPRKVNPPIAPKTLPTASESSTALGSGPLDRAAQEGHWSFVVTGVYRDGTQSQGGAHTGPALLSGTNYVKVTGLPIFPDIGVVECAFRMVYASIFEPPPAAGIPDFTIGNTRRVALILNNTADEAEFPFGVSLIGGENDPPNLPPVPLPPVSGDVLTVDDSTPTLQRDPAVKLSTDFKTLRNRVYVIGKGTILVSDANVGDRSLVVADVSSFPSAGGKFDIGHRVMEYSSLFESGGVSAIVLTSPLTEPILQSEWLFGGGMPVRPIVQVDDLESQNFCSLAELDENGLPTDGIHEHQITDDSLATPQQMRDAGMAQLQYAWPRRSVEYSIRDAAHRKGETVYFDLTRPPINGYFVINEVSIDQYYDVSDSLAPRLNVKASTVEPSTFHDLLRSIESQPESPAAAVAGVVNAAVARVQSEGGLKRATVTVTAEQMRTLFSSPVEVIPAGPNVFVVKAVVREVVTTGFDDDTFLQLAYAGDTGNPFMLAFGQASINQTPYDERFHLMFDNEDTLSFTNTGVVLQAEMDVSGGDGELEVTLYYVETD